MHSDFSNPCIANARHRTGHKLQTIVAVHTCLTDEKAAACHVDSDMALKVFGGSAARAASVCSRMR